MKKFANLNQYSDDELIKIVSDKIITRLGKMKPYNQQINDNIGFENTSTNKPK